MMLETIANQLEALGAPTRLSLYRSLVRAGDEGRSVGSLQAELQLPRSTLSHHLHRLIAAGLVSQERQATTLICRANYQAMERMVTFLQEECCIEAEAPRSETA